jgi:hypothetical protein
MTGPSAAVDSSSGKSRNSRCSCFAPAPGNAAHRASSVAAVHADKGNEPALTLEDLDYTTACLLLNTVTSLAAGLECVVLIFMVGQHLA